MDNVGLQLVCSYKNVYSKLKRNLNAKRVNLLLTGAVHFCFPFVGTVKDLKSIFVGGVDALSSNLHE